MEKASNKPIISKKNTRLYRFFKKIFDMFFAFLLLLLIWWVLLIIMIAIKANSKGPTIFKDYRVGRYGKEIKVYKFRTMFSDAETNIDKYLTPEEKELWTKERKLENDPRITKVGKFLRKTSLDELPQILNVLTGDLSFVGPRPVTQNELLFNYSKHEMNAIISLKPGITGYWQVEGRNKAEYCNGERQKLELEYVAKASLWLDIKILFKTIPAVLKHKGVK